MGKNDSDKTVELPEVVGTTATTETPQQPEINFGRFAVLAPSANPNSPLRVDEINTEKQNEQQNEPHKERPTDDTGITTTQHDLFAAEVADLRKQREHAEALFEDMRNNFSQTLQQHDHTLRMLTEEHNNQMRELRQHIQTRPTATVPRPHTSSRPATGSYWWSNMPRHADPSSYARSTPGGSGPGGGGNDRNADDSGGDPNAENSGGADTSGGDPNYNRFPDDSPPSSRPSSIASSHSHSDHASARNTLLAHPPAFTGAEEHYTNWRHQLCIWGM